MARVAVIVGVTYAGYLFGCALMLRFLVERSFPDDCAPGECDSDLRALAVYLVGVPVLIGVCCLIWATLVRRLTGVSTDVTFPGSAALFAATVAILLLIGPMQSERWWEARVLVLAAVAASLLGAWCAWPRRAKFTR